MAYPIQAIEDTTSDGMSVARVRAILGCDAHGLTDAEVLEANRQAALLAHIIVQMFLESTGTERQP